MLKKIHQKFLDLNTPERKFAVIPLSLSGQLIFLAIVYEPCGAHCCTPDPNWAALARKLAGQKFFG
jgi:hypothetical protein